MVANNEPARWYETASRHVRAGRINQAREALEHCLALEPDCAAAIALLAFVHVRAGELERALENIDRAIELRCDNDGDLHNRAVVLTAMGRDQDAVHDYERALELNPNSGGSHNNLAWLLATTPDSFLRDGSRAVTHARRALEIGSNGAWIDTLAAALAETGDFEQAAAIEERALAASQPTNESFRRRLELYRRRTSYTRSRGSGPSPEKRDNLSTLP